MCKGVFLCVLFFISKVFFKRLIIFVNFGLSFFIVNFGFDLYNSWIVRCRVVLFFFDDFVIGENLLVSIYFRVLYLFNVVV